MQCGTGLQPALYGAGAGGVVTAALALAARALLSRAPLEAPAEATAVSADGRCICECHFALPEALSSTPAAAWILLAGLALGGFGKPLLRAGVRVLAWAARELEGSFAHSRRPKHLPAAYP